MSNKVNFKWINIKQKAFIDINWIVAYNTLSLYPNFNKLFLINTDSINAQLVVVIIQSGKPIHLYSIKLTVPQKGYIVTEKELLIIVKTLKLF